MWAAVLVASALAAATTAQDAASLDLETTLCDGNSAGDFFRLSATTCRDVYACTSERRLHALRCPTGLAFDVERQTCDWSHTVHNCHVLRRNKTGLLLPNTPEPICEDDAEEGKRLACADGLCIAKAAFCNGTKECADGSDEAEALCGSAKTDPNGAPTCDHMPIDMCKLPECFCSATGIKPPGEVPVKDIPMMIAITFEDAINKANVEVFQRIFDPERTNPNGCYVKGTFFVSHEYTNYSLVEGLHNLGHEIATHSVSHDNNPDYWRNGNTTQWTREADGMRTILSTFAGIPEDDIRGFRSPMMRLGGNAQFAALSQSGFKYDASVVAGVQDPPLWPYTLHSSLPHPCHGYRQRCPTKPYGIWEIVINELDTSDSGRSCVTPDTCNLNDPEELYNVLATNFVRSQSTNKAPLGLHFQAAWFAARPDMLEALLFWMDEVLRLYPNEAYFVTLSDVLAWMEQPMPLSQMDTFEAWHRGACNMSRDLAEDAGCKAGRSRTCVLTSEEHRPGAHHRLDTCNEKCPASYPWLLDPTGENAPNSRGNA